MFLKKRVYQGSSGKVYPLPFVDRIAVEETARSWQAVHLENELLRVMILPELGGRIHVALDKTSGYEEINDEGQCDGEYNLSFTVRCCHLRKYGRDLSPGSRSQCILNLAIESSIEHAARDQSIEQSVNYEIRLAKLAQQFKRAVKDYHGKPFIPTFAGSCK